jgi:hypothetical protein
VLLFKHRTAGDTTPLPTDTLDLYMTAIELSAASVKLLSVKGEVVEEGKEEEEGKQKEGEVKEYEGKDGKKLTAVEAIVQMLQTVAVANMLAGRREFTSVQVREAFCPPDGPQNVVALELWEQLQRQSAIPLVKVLLTRTLPSQPSP